MAPAHRRLGVRRRRGSRWGGTNLQQRADLFREHLSSDIGEPVVVEFDLIPVDMVEIISKLPEPQAGEKERNKA